MDDIFGRSTIAGCSALRHEVPESSAPPALLEAVAGCSALPGLLKEEEAKKQSMALSFSSKIMIEHPLEPKHPEWIKFQSGME